MWRGYMSSVRGKFIIPEIREVAVNVKKYFDHNKKTFGVQESSTQMTADAIGIGLASVKRIMADFKKDPCLLDKPPLLRGRPAYGVDASYESIIRSYIRESNKNGSYITLETIRDFLDKELPGAEFHRATLARTLERWGFIFGKGTRSQHLKEKDHVIAARQRYLRRKIANRSGLNRRPEVYLDESYVNKNHSNDFIWYFDEDGPWVQKPTGKGERLIILNAITKSGWVQNAKLIFKSTKKTGDYHGQMNNGIFQKWFTNMLLPNIPKNSLIIMDNASYHNVLAACSAPLPTSKKSDIRAWLLKNNESCSEDMVKSELIELLKKKSPDPTYEIDELAKQNGHEILRTPPYHPELQPIEICWGVVKNHVARNSNFTMDNLISQLDIAFAHVTEKTCGKIIDKVKKIEDDFLSSEAIIDLSET